MHKGWNLPEASTLYPRQPGCLLAPAAPQLSDCSRGILGSNVVLGHSPHLPGDRHSSVPEHTMALRPEQSFSCLSRWLCWCDVPKASQSGEGGMCCSGLPRAGWGPPFPGRGGGPLPSGSLLSPMTWPGLAWCHRAPSPHISLLPPFIVKRRDSFKKCLGGQAVPIARRGKGSMHETGCSGLVHWEDPEGWDGEGRGRGVQDGDHMYTNG